MRRPSGSELRDCDRDSPAPTVAAIAIAANATTGPPSGVSAPSCPKTSADPTAMSQTTNGRASGALGPTTAKSATPIHAASCCHTLTEGPAANGKRKTRAISDVDTIEMDSVVIAHLR